MTQVVTPFGRSVYKPAWLEGKLEEYMLSAARIPLPDPAGVDLSDFPQTAGLCRYIIASHRPFDGVIYTKELAWDGLMRPPDLTRPNAALALAESLSDPNCLRVEAVQFILGDGLIMLSHGHHGNRRCEDEEFALRWGGGELSTCPVVALDPATRYQTEGCVLGRDECLHALEVVVRDGGLHLRY